MSHVDFCFVVVGELGTYLRLSHAVGFSFPRERSARHEPQEPKQQQQQQQQRASSRGRGAVRPEHHHQQQPASTPRGEQAGAAALKVPFRFAICAPQPSAIDMYVQQHLTL